MTNYRKAQAPAACQTESDRLAALNRLRRAQANYVRATARLSIAQASYQGVVEGMLLHKSAMTVETKPAQRKGTSKEAGR